jgi:hypothetical protein
MTTWSPAMRNVLKLVPLPPYAAFFIACSGSAALDSAPPVEEGRSELPLAAARDGAADKGHRDGGTTRRHHRRHRGGRGHHPTPPEPQGQSCEVAGQSFPDGSAVPSGDSCNSCFCTDADVACTRALCEPVVCAAFVETPDGVCSRFPLDPCISQDPDCREDDGSCEAAGQTFPDGSAVPSGDSCNSCACNDGSVICTLALCEPAVCTEFLEAPDGVCSRFPLDPCKFQDPDCAEPEQPSAP